MYKYFYLQVKGLLLQMCMCEILHIDGLKDILMCLINQRSGKVLHVLQSHFSLNINPTNWVGGGLSLNLHGYINEAFCQDCINLFDSIALIWKSRSIYACIYIQDTK